MKSRSLASLELAIGDWIDRNADDFTCFFGENTAELMARAAASVLDAVEESQQHALDQGHFKGAE